MSAPFVFEAATSAQLREQITAAAVAGSLPAGTKLPTVRALADQLGLAPNTVAKAYRELENAGVIETRGRAGSYVALDVNDLDTLQAALGAHEAIAGIAPRRLS